MSISLPFSNYCFLFLVFYRSLKMHNKRKQAFRMLGKADAFLYVCKRENYDISTIKQKTFMKNYILTLLFALVSLTACDNSDEYYYKTPGEVTGEKIMELVESGYPSNCYIYPSYLKKEVSFTIEGQFLYVYDNNKSYAFDLNHLNSWIYYSDLRVFEFYFDKME